MNYENCFADMIAYFLSYFSFKKVFVDIVLLDVKYLVFLLFLYSAEMKYKVTI